MFFRFNKIGCVLRLLLLGCLLATIRDAWAGDFHLESAGVRGGFATETGDQEFHQLEAFLNCNLPWGWDLGYDLWLQTRLDASAGAFGDSSRGAAVVTAGPSVILSYGKVPLSLEVGLSPTAISRHEFETRDLGSYYQFTSHVGVNFDFLAHCRLSYRFQHMSNAGFAEPNPGLNMHIFGLGYLF